MIIAAFSLLLTVLSPNPSDTAIYTYDSLHVMVLHPSIGHTIDRKERAKYQFFPARYFPRPQFDRAQFVKDKNGIIFIRAVMLDGTVYERPSTLREFQYNYRKVEYFASRRTTERYMLLVSVLLAMWMY